MIDNNGLNLTFNGAQFVKHVNACNTSGYYRYMYPSSDTNIFFDLAFSVKNTSDFEKSMDSIFELDSMKVGEKNYYSCSVVHSESNQIDNVYSWDYLNPLAESTMHVLIEVPEEIANSADSASVELDVAGKEEILNYR